LTALLLTSYTIQELGGDLAAATYSDHSGAAAWVGKNLNIPAKAVTNQKTPLFRDGVFKNKKMLINCSASYGG
jgi:hypothetical protein